MKIDIASVFGERLQGEPSGRRAFLTACEKLNCLKPGHLVILDFSKVAIVTASWISAMLLPLYRWAADDQTNLFIEIVYGSDEDWLDDLRLVARHNRKFFLVRPATEGPVGVRLIGPLEESERRTLQKIADFGEVTGAQLERECPQEKIRATGWNNRLKDLYEKRVLRREKRGREQVYTLVQRGMLTDG